jgi:hypothetical protein
MNGRQVIWHIIFYESPCLLCCTFYIRLGIMYRFVIHAHSARLDFVSSTVTHSCSGSGSGSIALLITFAALSLLVGPYLDIPNSKLDPNPNTPRSFPQTHNTSVSFSEALSPPLLHRPRLHLRHLLPHCLRVPPSFLAFSPPSHLIPIAPHPLLPLSARLSHLPGQNVALS